jgi:hypothetical protein|nr:MAG TPA: hypothetical protein [Caudoviricetes sp.]
MMPIKRNMTQEEHKQFHREMYENEKKGLTDFFHEQKYDEKHLKEFLVNSLKQEFEEELKQDKLL